MSIGAQKTILDFLSTPTLANLLTMSTAVQLQDIQDGLSPAERRAVADRLIADGFHEAAKIVSPAPQLLDV
jgi:hypothetical protein